MSGDSDGQYTWLILVSSFMCTYLWDMGDNPSVLEVSE